MTDSRGLRRRRRAGAGADGIPRDLARWFAGEPAEDGEKSVPWSALIFPDCALLHERWMEWKAAHPGARPPAGYEWIETPPTGHAATLVEIARAMLGRRPRNPRKEQPQ